MSIYQVTQGGALIGPVTVPPVPGAGDLLPEGFIKLPAVLANPGAGKTWAWDGVKAVQAVDRRGIYFRTTDGGLVEHLALGLLPDGLTSDPRPSPDHGWAGESWEIDQGLVASNRLRRSDELCREVDTAADAARRAVAGDPLRAVEYDRARIEAEQFAAAGYLGDVPPMVAAWAINGRTSRQATDSILAEAAQYTTALVQLRTVRLNAKEQIRNALAGGNIEQAEAVATATIASIEAAVAGVGNNAGV